MQSKRKIARLFCFVLWGGVLLMACGAPPEKACLEDRQCAKGEICLQERCLKGCRQHADCADKQYCRDLQCNAQLCTPGQSRECYDGDEKNVGKGLCKKGKQWCDAVGASWGACVEQNLPQDEVCDGLDNNCDGQVDEGLQCQCNKGERRRCYTGPVGTQGTGLCTLGVQYCEDNNRWGACHDQGLPRRELCDGLDNDCNGAVDDGIDCTCEPGAQRECYSGAEETKGVGACKTGKQTCRPDRKWGICDGQVLPRPEESAEEADTTRGVCDGVDNNCDGFIDNRSGKANDPIVRVCYDASPASLRKGDCKEGIQRCEAGVWSACEGQLVPKAEECNGKDDDCNGLIDDAIPARPCLSAANTGCKKTASGSIQCLGNCLEGQERCVDGKWDICQGEVLPLAQELCGNNQDDDCNGLLDNGCVCKDGETRACYSGVADTRKRGECKDGVQRCVQSRWGDCQGDTTPQSEVCNGKDDDCDGLIDNLANADCVISGQIGLCGQGKLVCENNQPQCKGFVSTEEVCDGKDNNCDGFIDNIVDLGLPCTNPLAYGPCKDGVWRCENNQKVCKPLVQASNEVCNGVDDDCDGVVDAGCVACKSHTDCGGAGLCVNGFCDKTAQCASASDCPTDQVCKQSRCAYCALGGADCPTGQLCIADTQKQYNRCQPVQCVVNSNCSFGLVCKQNRCQNCASQDAQGNPINECGGQSVCLQGKCYTPCVIDLDCGSAMTQRCTPMPNRTGVSSSLCLPRCTQGTDCPQGFACSAQTCVIAPVLVDGGFRPSDLFVPESCTAYRYPETGYQAQTSSGTYWIKPQGVAQPYKVYCDLNYDEGGFQLLARYTTRLNLKNFQPDKHQIQDPTTGQTLEPTQHTAPNLADISTYGHVSYTQFTPLDREIRVICRGTSGTTTVSIQHTDYSIFKHWNTGDHGTYGGNLWGFIATGGVARTGTEMCGKTSTQSGSPFSGMALCTGNTDTLDAHRISWRFDQITGKPTFVCDGKVLTDGTIEVWGRAWGRNPLSLNSLGVRQWKDGSYAPTCREYRFSEGGQYSGTTGSGAYMIQPLPNNPPFRVYCDMAFDANSKKGGWTLFARYSMFRPFKEFHPFAHFVQTTNGLLTERQDPPDLTAASSFGHIHYGWFDPKNRDIRMAATTDVNGTVDCNDIRPTGVTSWTQGNTPVNGGFLKVYSFQQQSSVISTPCRDGGTGVNLMHGFLYCSSSQVALFGVFGGQNLSVGSLGATYRACRGVIHSHTDSRYAGTATLYLR